MTDIQPITVTRQSDGRATADRFSDMIAVTPEMIAAASPQYVTATVRFKFANGKATYRITGWSQQARAFLMEKLEGSLTPVESSPFVGLSVKAAAGGKG